MNEPYEHDPRIEEISKQLDALDAERIKLLEGVREKARKLMALRADLMMREQITLRILNASPLSTQERKWAEDNEEEFSKIKEETKGKRGSRRVQTVSAGG